MISISLALLAIGVGLIARHLGADSLKPFLYAAGAAIAIGVIFIFKFKRDPGPITSDERDKAIEKNADLISLGAVYLLVVVASFAPIAVFGEDGTLPVTLCPFLLIGAAFCQTYARALAILVQYGWGTKGESL